MSQPSKLFPLEPQGPLTATVRWRGREFAHRLAAPTTEDWLEYDRRARVVVNSLGGVIESETTADDAADWLWAKLVQGVEGYGDAPADWRERMPLSHRVAAIDALAQAAPSEQADEELDPFGDELVVTLEAARSGVVYENLRHIFRRPATSAEKEY